jgi:hypothetical protein
VSLSKTITPVRIDLITEAMTYVPSFYRGRALAVEELPVRFIALPHTQRVLSPSEYTYQWELNNSVLFGGPIKGKYAIDMPMPRYDDHILKVTVFDPQGHIVGTVAQNLSSAHPELHFYEQNILTGVQFRALSDTHILIGDEVTLTAQPFFIAERLDQNLVAFTWNIDGKEVSPGDVPHEITLRKTGASGSANITAIATSQSTIPRIIEDSLTVSF